MQRTALLSRLLACAVILGMRAAACPLCLCAVLQACLRLSSYAGLSVLALGGGDDCDRDSLFVRTYEVLYYTEKSDGWLTKVPSKSGWTPYGGDAPAPTLTWL